MIKSVPIKIVQLILYWEASIFRGRFSGPVIVIAGSVGKTGTKEAIGKVVTKYYGAQNCIVTPKSLNTEIGVPLTILSFNQVPTGFMSWFIALFRGLVVGFWGALPKCMVLEIGADKKGDVSYLGRLARPTHAVITNVSESHSESLGTLDEIRQEKASLLQFLSLDGWAILNGDDSFLAKLPIRGPQHKTLVRQHARADYFVTGVKIGLRGTEAVLHHANRTQRLRISRYGEHHLYSVLFAAAVADSLHIPSSIQLQAFKELRPLPGRGMLIEGKKGSLLLDESYNAQPAAMRASLELLKQMPAKKRVAILGDMRELREPQSVHREVGKRARHSADYIIAVGPLSREYAADEWFMTAEEAIPAALRQLGPGVIVLIKGSQNTIRLERVVKAIMLNPTSAKKLLVRQEDEWLRKP